MQHNAHPTLLLLTSGLFAARTDTAEHGTHTLHTAALAFVSFGFVLVQVQVHMAVQWRGKTKQRQPPRPRPHPSAMPLACLSMPTSRMTLTRAASALPLHTSHRSIGFLCLCHLVLYSLRFKERIVGIFICVD